MPFARPAPLIALCFALIPAVAAAQDGRSVFVDRCGACHGVATAGVEPRRPGRAPDLGGGAGKGGADWILRYVDAGHAAAVPHRPRFNGAQAELRALVDWLLEQPDRQAGE